MMTAFNPNAEADQLTWAEVQTFVRRYYSVILITFCAVVVSAYTTINFMTDQYESKASLLVKLGRENIELPTTVQNTGMVTTGMRPEDLNSEIQLLKSQPVLDEVVDQIGVGAFTFEPPSPKNFFQAVRFYAKKGMRWSKARYNDLLIALNLKKRLTPREAVLTLLQDAIEASPEKTSDVLSVTVRLPSAPLAVRVQNTLINVYFARRAELHHNSVEREFLRSELEQKKQEIDDLSTRRDEIRGRYGVSSIPEQRDMLLKEIADMQTQLDNDRGTNATLRRQQNLMRQRLPDLSNSIETSEVQTLNPAVQSYKDRLSQLQLERAKLTSRYLDTAGPVIKIDEEIAALQAQLKKEPDKLTGAVTAESNPVRRSFVQNTEQNDVVLAGLDAHISELSTPMHTAQAKLHSLDVGEQKLESVNRELKILEDAYADLYHRAQVSQFGDQLEQSHIANVTLLGPPSEPIEPVYPRKLLIMAISLPVGILLGLVLAFLLHAMDDTIYSEKQLSTGSTFEYLGEYTPGTVEAVI